MSVSYGGSNITFEDGSVQSGGWTGFKNRIINGAMQIDQRNTATTAVTVNALAVFYGVDRFRGVGQGSSGVFTMQQVNDAPTGFKKSLKVTVTTADSSISSSDRYFVQQSIEGNNVSDLAFGTASSATVTISFWVKSSLTGTFGGCLQNDGPDRSYPFSYTINQANTWEKETITIIGDTTGTWATDNSAWGRLTWALGTGSTNSSTAGSWQTGNFEGVTGQVQTISNLNATWQITGVQLERGTTASSFEYRSYGTELALCQRYYYRLKQPSGTNSGVAAGVAYTTTNVYGQVNFPVEMRTNPTALEQNGTAADYDTLTNGNLNVCTLVPSFENATVTTSLLLWRYSSATVTVGSGAICRMRNSTSYLAWSAEL